ncbi:MAG TPA: GNAT family N-acetyltransferase [Phnomibacter sp.]|nr:GNAT family N-acetyltransferase [Phnomibacter sp.]
MTIRPATNSDIPGIQMIAALTWPHAYADILTPRQVEYMLNMMYSHATLQKQMLQEGHQFFVAESEDKMLGFAGCSPDEDRVWKLHKLYVLPFQQKSGLGKSLLQIVEVVASKAGAEALVLNVNRQNNANAFYKHLGFEIDSVGDFDIGAGFFMNDYVMKKQLV